MYDPRNPHQYSQLVAARASKRETKPTDAEAATPLAVDAASKIFNLPSARLEKAVTELTPTELRRHRLAISAALGNSLAVEMERDEHDAAVLERKKLGLDGKTRGSKFLEKMGATSKAGVLGRNDAPGLSTPLVLEPSRMAAGGSVLAEAKGAQRPPVTGRPSMTLLLRNVAGGKVEDPESLRQDIQLECAKYGVVKLVRVHQLDQLPEGWAPGESVRVLVKFESAAVALKASSNLHWRHFDGRRLIVSFFPFHAFEQGEYGPAAGEERVPF